MYTAGSEVDLDPSLCLQVLRVKRNFLLLLLPSGFNQQRIAKIVVMKMKRRFIVSVSIGLDDLPVGDPGILDQDVYIRAPLPICPAHKPFDRKPMVGFMRRSDDRRETSDHGNGQDPFPPSQLTLYGLSAPHVLWADTFFRRRALASASHNRKVDHQRARPF